MADIQGKQLVWYIGDGAGSETFAKIGATTSDGFSISNSVIERNTKDSSGWTEVFPSGTLKTMSGTISGEWNDSAAQQRLKAVAESLDPKANFWAYDGAGNKYVAEFQIENYELTGETEGFVTFSCSLRNNGTVTKTTV